MYFKTLKPKPPPTEVSHFPVLEIRTSPLLVINAETSTLQDSMNPLSIIYM